MKRLFSTSAAPHNASLALGAIALVWDIARLAHRLPVLLCPVAHIAFTSERDGRHLLDSLKSLLQKYHFRMRPEAIKLWCAIQTGKAARQRNKRLVSIAMAFQTAHTPVTLEAVMLAVVGRRRFRTLKRGTKDTASSDDDM